MTDPTALPNFPPPADEHPVRGRVLDVLGDFGLAPNLDADGDVAFVANEQQLFLRSFEGQPSAIRVFGQWAIQDELKGDRLHLLEVCNEVSLNMNCVTTGIALETLVVSSEHLVPEGADLAQILTIAIQSVLQGVHIWHQRALGIDPNDPSEAPEAVPGDEVDGGQS
jgi:hypothetical protein